MGEDLLPLLADAPPELKIFVGENDHHDPGPELVVEGDLDRMHKALKLFSKVPSFGKPTTIDPFVNKTGKMNGVYENAKTVLLLPVMILRLLVVAAIMVVGFFATKIALAGWEKGQVGLPKWRRKVMAVTRLCGRGILCCFGFHWIRRIGKPAHKDTAPIVVSNHVSFIDPIFYFYELFPSIVSSESHDSIFLAGTIIRSMQVIPVDRTSAESRKYATVEIKGDISLANVLFRMLTQFNNFMEVEYLPVVYPSAREVENPAEFAERVRHVMAQALCVPVTEHTYGDLMLSVNAQRLCLRSPANYMVEMGKIEKVLGLRTGDVKSYLEKFAAMNPTYCGTISMNQFLEWHHLPRCWISKKMFDLYDQSGQGFINFREFVAASGSISKSKDFKSQMKAAFNACNLRSDGCISALELEKTLKLSMPSISSAKVKMWFKKLDLHGDGIISWEEFQAFIEANPELLPIFMVGTF